MNDILFRNNNQGIVKRMAKRSIKAEKVRNVLIIITIAFSTCLILATMLYFFGTQRASLNRAEGMYQATISNLDEKTADVIKNDDRVLASFSYMLGMLDYGEYKVTVRSMDENLIQLAKYPAMNGRLPESENEVAVTQAFLDRKGLSVGIGDIIQLGMTGNKQDYIICGVLPNTDSNYTIYVTPSFVKKYAEQPLYIAYISAKGTDGLPEDSIKQYLNNITKEWEVESRDIDFSSYYFSLIRQRSSQYLMVIIFVILIVSLASALVIYSLFFVSIIRKTNEYGKLRTIGATARQIRRMVMTEGRTLFLIAFPIGFITGAMAGYALVPNGWNLFTVLGAGAFVALLMYFCVMFTVKHPAKLASAVTPIEAIRTSVENEETFNKHTKKLNRSLLPRNLAFINFSRNKKKTILTITSLGICGTLLMASSAYFNSVDPVNVAREVFPYGQIRIELGDYGSQSHNSEQFFELQKSNPLSPDLAEQIVNIEGVKDIKIYSGTVLNMTTPTGYENPCLADGFGTDQQELIQKYLLAGTADIQELIQNKGILIKQMPQWNELFGWEVSVGDKIILQIGANEPFETTVMGIVDESIPYGGNELMFIPLETLKSMMPIDNLNYQILIDTDDNDWEEVRKEISKILPTNARVYVTTLNAWVENYEGLLANYRTPVYVFILFIGVFGILNLLNTLITNVLVRKRELGVLQAVGMSSRQVSKMLLMEGLLYTFGAFFFSILFGTLFGILICKVFSAMSVLGEVSYHFPILEMTGFFVLILTAQVIFSLVTIKQLRSQSLVDQIRELA